MKYEGSWNGVGVRTNINLDGSTSNQNVDFTYEIVNLGNNAYSINVYNESFGTLTDVELKFGGFVDKRDGTLITSGIQNARFAIDSTIFYFKDKELYNSFTIEEYPAIPVPEINPTTIYVVTTKLTKTCINPPKNKKNQIVG
jgi:hypothetical protein